MSWLRSSPLRQNLTRNLLSSSTTSSSSAETTTSTNQNSRNHYRSIDTTDCDPKACYDSFCIHWQQAYEIILKADPQRSPTHDDVLGVVSHLDYMVTLLLVELHHCNKTSLPNANQTPSAPCLEYLLSENLLDKLYEWGITTGRYANAVRLEQLKLYELLVSHSRHQLLVHEPFLRPLLKILASSQGEKFPPDVEKRLVLLLNQLCVVLMQNVHLLDLFFFSSNQHGQGKANFILFSLLIPFVHREGSLGHQARDALLLCMALSQKNSNVGTYIAQYSSMCPLLVTGLGGLYSRLPNTIEINSIDWHRITPDDVTEIPELTLFMNSLEFCNAVVQVAHDLIKQQLLDFIYQGFIVPVLGPSILQIFKGKHLQTNIESQISATAYLDLIIRSVTEPGLLKVFIKFLLDEEKFDGQRIIDVMVDRLNSTDPNLCMVMLSFFDTLLSLYCEDIILELFLKYLLPGKHVPISYRHKINRIDPYINTVEFFLNLSPDIMKHSANINNLRKLNSSPNSSNNHHPIMTSFSKTIGANWNHYGLNSGDSLYSNYHAYLFDAHQKITQCRFACRQWSDTYKYQKPIRKYTNNHNLSDKTIELIRSFLSEFSVSSTTIITSAVNAAAAATTTVTTGMSAVDAQNLLESDKNKYDSLQSTGESSGYESFKWRPEDEFDAVIVGSSHYDDTNQKSSEPKWKISNRKEPLMTDLDFSEDIFAQGTVSLGPFLSCIWSKLQTFTSNSLFVNLHLTGLITRIALYPLPLIHSILLRPDIVISSDSPSFHQILRILKQQIDAELSITEDSLEIIDVARLFLIDREFRLINARKKSVEILKNSGTPPQLTPTSSYDPFRRNDTKRKSFSQSITSMFRKPSSTTLSQFTFSSSPSSSTLNNSNNNLINNNIQLRETNTSSNFMNNSLFNNNNYNNHGIINVNVGNNSNTIGSGGSITSTSNNNSSATIGGNIGSGGGGNSEPTSLDSLSSMTSTIGAIASTSGTDRTRDLALCAVLLDEWLKELAAISQEQSVVMLGDIS